MKTGIIVVLTNLEHCKVIKTIMQDDSDCHVLTYTKIQDLKILFVKLLTAQTHISVT
jgi:hypothetical protein